MLEKVLELKRRYVEAQTEEMVCPSSTEMKLWHSPNKPITI